MFPIKFQRHQFTVKPAHFGFNIKVEDDRMTLEEKIEHVTSLKDLYYEVSDSSTLMVEEDLPIDELIFMFKDLIQPYMPEVQIVIDGSFLLLTRYIPINVSCGHIPVRPFLKMRKKDHLFYIFLLRMLRLVLNRHGLLDTRALDGFVEQHEDELEYAQGHNNQDDIINSKQILRIAELITSFYNDIHDFDEYVDTVQLRAFQEKYPRWHDFLEDCLNAIPDHDIFTSSFNLDVQNLSEEGFNSVDELFSFRYAEDYENAYDQNLFREFDGNYGYQGFEEPYVYVRYKKGCIKKNILERLDEDADICSYIFKLFTTNYECFNDRKI